MKKLYLLRHAKSDWGNPNLADIDRPLNARGIKVSKLLGSHFEKNAIRPDLILCSPARRTRQTLNAIIEETGREYQVRYEKGLYESGAENILDIIRKTAGSVNALMIIGHNPGLEMLAHSLIKTGKPKALAKLDQKYPTGGLATLDLNIDHWQDLGPGLAELKNFEIPKEIM
jgi:phosphohistidine phosphatase